MMDHIYNKKSIALEFITNRSSSTIESNTGVLCYICNSFKVLLYKLLFLKVLCSSNTLVCFMISLYTLMLKDDYCCGKLEACQTGPK